MVNAGRFNLWFCIWPKLFRAKRNTLFLIDWHWSGLSFSVWQCFFVWENLWFFQKSVLFIWIGSFEIVRGGVWWLDEVVTSVIDGSLGLKTLLSFVLLEGVLSILFYCWFFNVIVRVNQTVLILWILDKLETAFRTIFLRNHRVNQCTVIFQGQLDIVVDVKL